MPTLNRIYVFKTNQENYLIADGDIYLNSLDFEEEGLVYVCKLPGHVEQIVKEPERCREMGCGYGTYLVYATHVDASVLLELIEKQKSEIKQRLITIKGSVEYIPDLEAELGTLTELKKTISEQ